jgi:hypothetical protein
MNVYPNPSTGTFFVDNNNSEKGLSIRVIDMYGETLVKEELSDSKTSFDLSKKGKGVYFICLEKEDKTHVKKLIVG